MGEDEEWMVVNDTETCMLKNTVLPLAWMLCPFKDSQCTCDIFHPLRNKKGQNIINVITWVRLNTCHELYTWTKSNLCKPVGFTCVQNLLVLDNFLRWWLAKLAIWKKKARFSLIHVPYLYKALKGRIYILYFKSKSRIFLQHILRQRFVVNVLW